MQRARLAMSGVRERLEEWEAQRLSPHAALSAASAGRALAEPPDDLRTEFQRDRDRVLHTNAFRRLKHKTQVFIAPVGDHFVTRLSHTLEVAQIGRTIARALRLNEDLVEAACLGHDVGHTPFGHVGEAALDGLMPGGFRHNEQSLRTVDLLEKEGRGLNLTQETRQAILHHSKPRGAFLDGAELDALTLEAQVVRVADAVAYLAHDVADALRAGALREEELPADARELLGTRHSQRVDAMVRDVVEASWGAAEGGGARPRLAMSGEVERAVVELREFMFERVYLPSDHSAEGEEAARIVEFLYGEFTARPGEVPERYFAREETPERAAVDYIAGMTDQFAVRTAQGLRPGFVTELFAGRI